MTLIQILFFSLIPLGIYSGVLSYRLGLRIFTSDTIAALPLNAGGIEFNIETAGRYSLWLEGKILSRTPVNQLKPQIIDSRSGSIIHLSRSLMNLHVSGFKMARVEMFLCHLTEGRYRLQVVDGTSLSPIGSTLSSIIIGNRPVNIENFSFLLKPRLSTAFIFLFILLMIFSIAGTIAGLVLGLLADQIF